MDTNNIIMVLFGIVQAGFAWWMKETWSNQRATNRDLKELRTEYDTKHAALISDVNDFKVSVAKEYASKDDIKEIKELLRQVAADLHLKADKV